MTSPELPVDPNLPGQPSTLEVERARAWLAKAGAPVSLPTRLLSIRIGVRCAALNFAVSFARAAVAGGVVVLAMVGYFFLQKVTSIDGSELTESGPLYLMFTLIPLIQWFSVRYGHREVRKRLSLAAVAPDRRARLRLAGGWYLASAAVTFVGGAMLAVAMFLTTPAHAYALSWLAFLAFGAIGFGVILTGTPRAPVLAEDEASRAVDEILRVSDLRLCVPATFALLIAVDLLDENRQPASFTVPLIVYMVLALGVQLIGVLGHRRRNRALPPGYYGAPVDAAGGILR